MSAPSGYRVNFVEWIAMEIVIDEATSPEDALQQAREQWEASSDCAKMRDNGTEAWEVRHG